MKTKTEGLIALFRNDARSQYCEINKITWSFESTIFFIIEMAY